MPLHTLLAQSFIAMMLDNDQGLYYPNYGPADQGIMNKVGGLGIARGWLGSEGIMNNGRPGHHEQGG